MSRIGFLATGDELVNGDILNTNCQHMATSLLNANFYPNQQLVVKDDEEALTNSILFLLQHNDILITTGGLGPTSDDKTRFAIAKALGRKLVFSSTSWKHICSRLRRLKLPATESKQVQAQFPENSEILTNLNGTANGAFIKAGEKLIFMLPGPPSECLPLFENKVLPQLAEIYPSKIYHKSWLLLGVAEGQTAELLEPHLEPSVQIGYRIEYPYLEVKLLAENKNAFSSTMEKFLPHLIPNLVSENRKKASEQLYHKLQKQKQVLTINDNATSGLLESTLLSPLTQHAVQFCSDGTVQVNGMETYWQLKADKLVELKLQIGEQLIKKTFPFRGVRTRQYAIEWICWKILTHLP